MVEIDRATAEHLKGVRPGINLPFSFRNQRVGVIGISGEPAEVRAYAELVKMAAEMMVEQAALLDQHQWEKRYREELANQLLQPQPNNASLEAMAAYLGLDLRGAHRVDRRAARGAAAPAARAAGGAGGHPARCVDRHYRLQ